MTTRLSMYHYCVLSVVTRGFSLSAILQRQATRRVRRDRFYHKDVSIHPHRPRTGTTTSFEVNNMSDLLGRVCVLDNQDLAQSFMLIPAPTLATAPILVSYC